MATDLERMLDLWRSVTVAELGDYTTIPVPPRPETGDRIVIVPKSAQGREDWYVAYLTEGRLVLDDYVPEIHDGTL